MEKEIVARYNKVAEMPSYAQPTIIKMVDGGFIGGTGSGAKDENNCPADLNLSIDMIRVFVTNDRAACTTRSPDSVLLVCYYPTR